MAQFREVIKDQDLVLQRRKCWLFGGWENWRNLDEELRALREHKSAAYAHFKQMERLCCIAEGNIKDRKDMLQVYLLDNSELSFNVDIEPSILEEREGVKYKFPSNQNNQKQKGNQQQQNNQKQKQKGQQQSSRNGQQKTISMSELLNSRLVLH